MGSISSDKERVEGDGYGNRITSIEQEHEREAVVREALTWIDTPFHHRAQVKGAGVDCIHFLYAPFRALKLIPEILVPEYPMQWYVHRDNEMLIEAILSVGGHEIQPPPRKAD